MPEGSTNVKETLKQRSEEIRRVVQEKVARAKALANRQLPPPELKPLPPIPPLQELPELEIPADFFEPIEVLEEDPFDNQPQQ